MAEKRTDATLAELRADTVEQLRESAEGLRRKVCEDRDGAAPIHAAEELPRLWDAMRALRGPVPPVPEIVEADTTAAWAACMRGRSYHKLLNPERVLAALDAIIAWCYDRGVPAGRGPAEPTLEEHEALVLLTERVGEKAAREIVRIAGLSGVTVDQKLLAIRAINAALLTADDAPTSEFWAQLFHVKGQAVRQAATWLAAADVKRQGSAERMRLHARPTARNDRYRAGRSPGDSSDD